MSVKGRKEGLHINLKKENKVRVDSTRTCQRKNSKDVGREEKELSYRFGAQLPTEVLFRGCQVFYILKAF